MQRIKLRADETELLVVDSVADEYYAIRGITVHGKQSNVIRKKTPACRKDSSASAASSSDHSQPEAGSNQQVAANSIRRESHSSLSSEVGFLSVYPLSIIRYPLSIICYPLSAESNPVQSSISACMFHYQSIVGLG